MTVGDRPAILVGADRGGDPSTPVVRLSGKLDLACVEAANVGIAPYLDASQRKITFDLEKLTFMDRSGIALLVEISNDTGRVTLINVAPIVRRVLEITGMLEHFGMGS